MRRVLVANEITDRAALAWLAGRLHDEPDLDVLWYVDSVAGVRLAAAAMARCPTARHSASLLLEVGHADGRTGVRSRGDALAVARAVAESPRLALAGVAGYEGTIGHDRSPATRQRVADFLAFVHDTFVALDEAGLLARGERVVTAGGSVFFDQVTEALTPLRDRGAVVVLRSGCYLTHDNGYYEQVSPDVEPAVAPGRVRRGDRGVGSRAVPARAGARPAQPRPTRRLLRHGTCRRRCGPRGTGSASPRAG